MEESNEDKYPDKKEDPQKGRLAEETINYFKRVEQVLLDNTFEDEEHKEMFVKNVFNQMEKDGSQLTRHPLTSRVIEVILPMLNAEQNQKLISQFKEDIDIVTRDRFASHVVEALCKNVSQHKEDTDVVETFLSFCKVLRKQSSGLLRDVYGSHVLSTVLQVLGGVAVPESITKSRSTRASKKSKGKYKPLVNAKLLSGAVSTTSVPENFVKSFKRFSRVIQEDDNFGELLCHRTASPVLQVLLYVIKEINKTKYASLCHLVVTRAGILSQQNVQEEEENEETIHRLPVVLTDEVGSHLIEAVIQTADDETFETLATRCFRRYIISLCIHPVANYLSQTFLRNIRSSEQADFYITKILEFMEDILASGNMGCIVRAAETLARLEMVEKQKLFLNKLQKALHIPNNEKDSKQLARLILTMMTYDMFFKKNDEVEENKSEELPITETHLVKNSINYHGACLLKSCFSFKKSKLAVDSFLSLTVEELLVVSCNPSGCFAFESFFQSKWIPKKKKDQVVECLTSSIYILACDKFGSRVIDAMWKELEEDVQDRLRCVLRTHKSKLETDLYGRIILYNCGVKQQVVKMSEIKEKQERKRKLFEEILDENKVHAAPVKKEKKTKNDDRANKYREQLKQLGISFDDEAKSD